VDILGHAERTDGALRTDTSRHTDASARIDTSLRTDAARHTDAALRTDAARHTDASLRSDAARHTDSGRHSDSSTPEDERTAAELARLRAQVAWLQAERAALWWAINHDELTGLGNRRLLNTLGPALLRRSSRCAVVVLDLNGFKPINDRYGHAVGDDVLRTVAHRLSRCIGDDLAVRLSGDEFAAILTESSLADPREDWSSLIDVLSETIAKPMAIGDKDVTVTASIGVAIADGEPLVIDELIRRADLAMYRAKTSRWYSNAVWD
jgi:diguanylate cyclase (GGDEF)-like protein